MAVPFDSLYLKTPCYTQTSRLYFIECRVIDDCNFTLWGREILRDLAAVTLTLSWWPSLYELDPYPLKIYPQTKTQLSTSRLLKVIMTDRRVDRCHAASHVIVIITALIRSFLFISWSLEAADMWAGKTIYWVHWNPCETALFRRLS